MSRTLIAKEQAAKRISKELIKNQIVETNDESDDLAHYILTLFEQASSSLRLYELATANSLQLGEFLMSLPFEEMSDDDKVLVIDLALALQVQAVST